MKKPTLVYVFLISTIFVTSGCSKSISYTDVLNRLIDLEHLSTVPDEGDRTAQWSSYDRSSKYDRQSGNYLNWSANGDGTGYIRKEGDSLVICEIDGPGVIWRIWTALPGEGLVEFYLDGATEPTLRKPFKDYFDNSKPPFNYPSLVYTSAKGKNCYLPITFSKSCKVVAHPGWGKYYHFTYSHFPKTTKVETFSIELAKTHSQEMKKIDDILSNCSQYDLRYKNKTETTVQTVEIPPGKTTQITAIKGAYAITSLKIKRNSLANMDVEALRQLILKIYWDGSPSPAVWSPVGDFFGSAPELVEYKSLPLGITSEYLYSYWYMPFKNSAVIEIQNDSAINQPLEFEISYIPLTKDPDNLLRFHSYWHVGNYGFNPKRSIDWTFLKTIGKGRFCGLMLHIWNPMGGWWGEGDEKFFVDGEKFPSTFGTGTEDYFGYAWCSEEFFNHPYHNQIVSVPNNPCAYPDRKESGGHTCNSRFHITDNVPFHYSFEGAIEKYFSSERLTHYAITAYWYQKQHGEAAIKPVPLQDRGFTRYNKDGRFITFLDALETYEGEQQIDDLRLEFDEFIKDDYYTKYHSTITVEMAKIEKKAGHHERAKQLLARYNESLAEPFIQRGYANSYFFIMGKPDYDLNGCIRPFIVESGDGAIEKIKNDGQWMIKTGINSGKRYLYFDLPDEIYVPENTNAVITACVNSSRDPQKDILLQYNTGHEIYKSVKAKEITFRNNNYEIDFLCKNIRFDGRQNSKSDFRIYVVNDDMYFTDVRVLLIKP